MKFCQINPSACISFSPTVIEATFKLIIPVWTTQAMCGPLWPIMKYCGPMGGSNLADIDLHTLSFNFNHHEPLIIDLTGPSQPNSTKMSQIGPNQTNAWFKFGNNGPPHIFMMQ